MAETREFRAWAELERPDNDLYYYVCESLDEAVEHAKVDYPYGRAYVQEDTVVDGCYTPAGDIVVLQDLKEIYRGPRLY